MTKGVIYLAPGQRPEVVQGIEDRGYTVVIDSESPVDGHFGTPVGKSVEFELKQVPDDLVSSMRQSARFSRQVIHLGANEGPALYIMVGYPEFAWRFDKFKGTPHYMMMKDKWKETGLTYPEYQGRILTMAMIGICAFHVPTWNDVAETVCGFYEEFQDKNHQSHLIRPSFAGGGTMESWSKPGAGDIMLHVWEGFPKTGRKKGIDLWKYFDTFRSFATVFDYDWAKKVRGVGPDGARNIIRVLDARYGDYFDEKGNHKR